MNRNINNNKQLALRGTNNRKVRRRKVVRIIKRTQIQPVKRRKPLPRIPRPISTANRIPQCTRTYLRAITDPWGAAQGACIPTFPSKPSMKVRTFIQVDASIGTQGIGYALLSPHFDSTAPALYYTSATFGGTALALSGTGVFNKAFTNSPFDANDMGEDLVKARTVAIGMRLVYTGTNLNKSGMTTCLTHPDHASLVGSGIAELLSFGDTSTRSEPVKNTWCHLIAIPISMQDFTYRPFPFSDDNYVNNPSGALPPFMAIMITGVPGQSFRIEVYHHFEAIGRKAISLTDNDADPSGAFNVVDAVGRVLAKPANKTPQKWYQKAWSFVKAAAPIVAGVAGALL